MKARILVLGTLMALALVLWLSREGAAPGDAGAAAGRTLAASQGAVPGEAILEQLEQSAERAPVAAVPSATDPRDRWGAAAPGELAHITGRLLLPGGEPASGAALTLDGTRGNSIRAQRHGVPRKWDDVIAVAGEDGRFELEFDPPRAFQFYLNAEIEGHAALRWRWSELLPGSRTDVGEVRFSPACVLRGWVVGTDGKPTGVPWRVMARPLASAGSNGAGVMGGIGEADPESGRFQIEGMPPGPASIRVTKRLRPTFDGPSVEMKAGEITDVEIVYDGPDLSSTISVTTFCLKFSSHSNPKGGSIVARSARGKEFPGKKVEGTSQAYLIEGVPPGEYEVIITSRVHRTWSRSGVRPGDAIEAQLEGNVTLALTVVDDRTNAPIDDYRLRLGHNPGSWGGGVSVIKRADRAAPKGGRYEELVPGELTVLVDAAGYAQAELPLGKVAAGETVTAAARLKRGGLLRVLVQEGTGPPASGVEVTLSPYEKNRDLETGLFTGSLMPAAQARIKADETLAITDDSGEAIFAALSMDAEYSLVARRGALLAVAPRVRARGAGGDPVVLSLPASGSVDGRILGGEAGDFEGLLVTAGRPGHQPFMRAFQRYGIVPQTTVGADGAFRLDALPPGDFVLRLGRAPMRAPNGLFVASSLSTPEPVLGRVDVTPGPATRVEFDGSALLPGTVVWSVEVRGKPGAGVAVGLLPMGGPRAFQQGGSGQGRYAGLLELDGQHEMTPVFPGKYHAVLQGPGETWRTELPEPVVVTPGSTREVTHTVGDLPSRIRVLDAANGFPASFKDVWIDGAHQAMTDPRGWLEWPWSPGTHVVSGASTMLLMKPEGTSFEVGPEGPLVKKITVKFPD